MQMEVITQNVVYFVVTILILALLFVWAYVTNRIKEYRQFQQDNDLPNGNIDGNCHGDEHPCHGTKIFFDLV